MHVIPETELMSSDSSSYSAPLASSLNPNLEGDYSHIDGAGQTVVVIDTGIDLDHPFFGPDNDGDGKSDRITLFKNFWFWFIRRRNVDGHGTHVSGIIASSDNI